MTTTTPLTTPLPSASSPPPTSPEALVHHILNNLPTPLPPAKTASLTDALHAILRDAFHPSSPLSADAARHQAVARIHTALTDAACDPDPLAPFADLYDRLVHLDASSLAEPATDASSILVTPVPPPLATRVRAYLFNLLAIAHWLPRYTRDDLQNDLIAGLTIGIMLVPQGMAYALLANMPPIYGLYSSFVPLIIYACFGTSRQLSVGPVALVSLLIAESVSLITPPGTELFVQLSIALALLVGLLQIAMGLLRLGILVSFLSHPVISGFTSASALIIGASQLKHLFDVKLPTTHNFWELLYVIAERLPQSNWISILVGLGGVAILLALKMHPKLKRVPGGLVVVIIGTLVGWGIVSSGARLRVLGPIPAGLPLPAAPAFTWEQLGELVPAAVTISFVSFLESIAVAKRFASAHDYDIDSNQELVGLGAANLVGAFFRAFPTTGGFSRTAVNDAAGARTPMAQVFGALVIMLTLLFLTPLFYYLPTAVLAAMVLVAVRNLINLREPRELWHSSKQDFAMLLLAFLATLSIGVEQGILIAMAVSLLLVVLRVARPHSAVLGRLPGTVAYRNVKRYPHVETFAHIAILRVDAPLFFFNMDWFQAKVDRIVRRLHPELYTLIIDASAINDVDSVALHTIEHLADDFAASNRRIVFAALKGPVRDKFDLHGMDCIPADARYLTLHDAVVAECQKRPDEHEHSDEEV